MKSWKLCELKESIHSTSSILISFHPFRVLFGTQTNWPNYLKKLSILLVPPFFLIEFKARYSRGKNFRYSEGYFKTKNKTWRKMEMLGWKGILSYLNRQVKNEKQSGENLLPLLHYVKLALKTSKKCWKMKYKLTWEIVEVFSENGGRNAFWLDNLLVYKDVYFGLMDRYRVTQSDGRLYSFR